MRWKNASRFKISNLILLKREKINTFKKERSLDKSFIESFKILKVELHYIYKLNLSVYWKIYNQFHDCYLKKYNVFIILKDSNETQESKAEENQINLQ